MNFSWREFGRIAARHLVKKAVEKIKEGTACTCGHSITEHMIGPGHPCAARTWGGTRACSCDRYTPAGRHV